MLFNRIVYYSSEQYRKKNVFYFKLLDIYRFHTRTMSSGSKTFDGTVDRYNGITIDTETESIDEQFADRLKCMQFIWTLDTSEHLYSFFFLIAFS